MKPTLFSKPYRWISAFVALVLVMLAMPFAVSADPGGMKLDVISVKRNTSVTLKARNFPAQQDFKVRIGSYYTFARSYSVMDYVDSGKGGDFEFTVKLPSDLEDGELVAVRVDSEQGRYAYNAFYNNNKNAPAPTAGTSTPAPQPSSSVCQVLSTSPDLYATVGKRADFDAVWEIKNTGGSTWSASSVDYKYYSGQKMYKYNSIYDLKADVKSGDKVKIAIDIKAPDTAGTYTMKWTLAQGSKTLCTMPLTIIVK